MAIQMLGLHSAMGGGGIRIRSLSFEGAWSNVISVTRVWVGVKFAEKSVM